MQIHSLVLTKRPVWINVGTGHLDRIELRANVRFWPEGRKNVALLLIDFEESILPDALAECNITTSALGTYVYLVAPNESGNLLQTVNFPKAKGRVKHIGLQLWGYEDPIVLDDMTVTPAGAELVSEYAVVDTLLNNHPELVAGGDPGPLALNLMLRDTDCNAYCHSICQNWYETMDDVARRHPGDNVGRINCSFCIEDGSIVPVTVFNGTPAMLRIPENHARYLESIGDKARNMIRKAQRHGYEYRQVDPDDYLDDVLAIRTSDPVRQGKPIPDYYKVRPVKVIDEPFCNGCEYHGEGFYGVFQGERLVAYATIFFYGELAQVNHILGHAEHLQEGIMNLLVSEMVADLIRNRPWVRAINYLYPHSSKASSGIGLFKRSIGFAPEKVLVAQNGPDLNLYFSKRSDGPETVPSALPSARKRIRAGTSKAVKLAASAHEVIRIQKAGTREEAVEDALRALVGNDSSIKVMSHSTLASLTTLDFSMPGSYAVVFDEVPFEDYLNFLSTGLKSLRTTVPKASYLVFDFKRFPDQDYVIKESGLARLLPAFFQRKSRRINQELLAYLLKRFKSVNLSIDDIRTGFKGSDYIVVALVEYKSKGQHHSYDSLLVLQKIR